MEYKLSNIRQRVLVDKLDDEEYNGTVVDNFINDTHREILNRYELPFQERIFSGTVPSSVTMFNLPTDVALMQYQTFDGVPGFQSKKMAWREFFERYPDNTNQTAGKPTAWTTYAGKIIFDRPTDADYNLTVYYVKVPTLLDTASSVPDLPAEFSELLVLGAYRRVLERNEDFDLADEVRTDFESKLLHLVGRYGFREMNGPIKMKHR